MLNVIRKTKSEAGVSIKAPVAEVLIYIIPEMSNVNQDKGYTWNKQFLPIISDLKAAGNVAEIVLSSDANLPYLTDSKWFKISVKLANVEVKTLGDKKPELDYKRNPEQAEHEKLDPDAVLHGAGTPDLSKHTVKVQVNRVPETLQRQK